MDTNSREVRGSSIQRVDILIDRYKKGDIRSEKR